MDTMQITQALASESGEMCVTHMIIVRFGELLIMNCNKLLSNGHSIAINANKCEVTTTNNGNYMTIYWQRWP